MMAGWKMKGERRGREREWGGGMTKITKGERRG
jgi:hypothetical protein